MSRQRRECDHDECPPSHCLRGPKQKAKGSFAAPAGSAKLALKQCCTMGILDRAILCGLGLSADSANIVMDHIEELRDEIKRLKTQFAERRRSATRRQKGNVEWKLSNRNHSSSQPRRRRAAG